MTPPEQNESTWDKVYQFLFGRGALGKAQGASAPAAPTAGGNVAAPVPGMGGKSMTDLAKEAAERAKKGQNKAKPAVKPTPSRSAASAPRGYWDSLIANAEQAQANTPPPDDSLLGLLSPGGSLAAGAAALPKAAGLIKRFSVDAKALSMPEIDALLTRAQALGTQTGAAAQRFGQQINNAKRAVYGKAIADPAAKWSVQDVLNMLSESTAKGSVKRALAEWIDNPTAQIQQGGRLYPLTQEIGKGLRGWISGQK
ncbi:MAG: hypothetical protein ABFD89_24395 [Bryobacteraceae bacterium]